MNLCIGLIIVSLLVRATLQHCSLFNVYQRFLPEFPRFSQFRKYVHCEHEMLSSDFHTRVPPIEEDSVMQWLEVNNTYSPTIEAGAFNNLSVQDLRINSAGVRVINKGAFFGLKMLRQLALQHNNISEVKDYYFTSLTYLEMLDLSYNIIKTISEGSFEKMDFLKRLILEHNALDELPVRLFRDMAKLEHLDLSFNSIIQIWRGSFDNLTNLDTLLLNHNRLVEFDSFLLSKNSLLQEVDISNNNLKGINNLLFSSHLNKLDLSYNSVEYLSFPEYTFIRIFDLSSNGIRTMKNILFMNIDIVELFLDHNYLGLRFLEADTFCNLTTLETLSMSDNQLSQIDPNLFKNNNRITKLDLSKNSLSTKYIFKLPASVKQLDLSVNNFNSSLNVTSLVNLKSLDISYNDLTEIPFNFLDGLKMLYHLNLSNNSITNVSLGCFKDLKSLRELDLSSNYISVLDIGVFVGLDTLLSLDISYNNLTKINDGVFHSLRFLQALNVAYNKVTYSSMANALAHLTVLSAIGLAGNGWSCDSLSQIVKVYKRLRLMDVAHYDTTNVDGVACTYSIAEGEMAATDLLLELEETSFEILAHKLYTNNVILTLILVVLVFKIVMKYFAASGMERLQSLFQRHNERPAEAIQLMESTLEGEVELVETS